MILDLNRTRKVKRILQSHLDSGKYANNRMQLITEVALDTSCPILAVMCYYGEIRGFDTEILNSIEKIKSFYQIKEIINIEGIPEIEKL